METFEEQLAWLDLKDQSFSTECRTGIARNKKVKYKFITKLGLRK